MTLIETVDGVRRALLLSHMRGRTIGLVPTMGALHAGHARLIEQAQAECHPLVVSIFVNPTQFNQAADFVNYPKTMDADLALCKELGVDIVFAPTAAEMYPGPRFTSIEVGTLGDHLCGPFRLGHFRGVATVVAKLLNIVQPERAYFGQKDAQQLAIIERMVADLNVPVDIIPVATIREPDGLAMSSRNVRLTPEERGAAPVLHRALQLAAVGLATNPNVERAKEPALTLIAAAHPTPRVEYLDVVDPITLTPLTEATSPALIAIAAWLGNVRLIDNIRFEFRAANLITFGSR